MLVITRPFTLFLLTALFAGTVFAASTPAPVRAEITRLLDKLQSSSCQFNRNGTWHLAADAAQHLTRKLDYIEKRTPLTSTEQFITLAATASSMSGNPYLVRCGAVVQPSAQWLAKELAAIRGQ
jgi:Family of unknown function (DUF5329)